MPSDEVLKTIRVAEDLGYDFCVMADEGFLPDVYVCLGAAARQTSRIQLGPVTNGFTRHPAVTAAAMATLNELSEGRALTILVAGGSMVLQPMGIQRNAPLAVVRDSIEIMHRLWSGESVTWEGSRHRLQSAQISAGKQDIPIWLAVRGPKLLELAGQMADGVVVMTKADLRAALEIVDSGSRGREHKPLKVYLDRIAYSPDLMREAATLYTYVVMDSPMRMLKALGLTEVEISGLQQAITDGGSAAAARLVTTEMINGYQIAGTPDECQREIHALSTEYKLDAFMLNIVSGGFQSNVRLMQDVRSIVADRVKEVTVY